MNHILRRTKKQLKDECKLPARNEYIVPCMMTQAQINIYEAYLKDADQTLRINKNNIIHNSIQFGHDKDENHNTAFTIINNLRKICNHPFYFFNYNDSPESKFSSKKYRYKNLEKTSEYQMYKELSKDSFMSKSELQNYTFDHWEMSSKMKVLQNFLQTWNKENEDN